MELTSIFGFFLVLLDLFLLKHTKDNNNKSALVKGWATVLFITSFIPFVNALVGVTILLGIWIGMCVNQWHFTFNTKDNKFVRWWKSPLE